MDFAAETEAERPLLTYSNTIMWQIQRKKLPKG